MTPSEIERLLEICDDFEAFFKEEVRNAEAILQSSKYSAPESYVNDMKGYSRGLSHMGNAGLQFFRKRVDQLTKG